MLPLIGPALEECGVHAQDVAAILEPLEAMGNETPFVSSHRDSICIYRSPQALHCFSVRAVVDTGWNVEERCVVGPILEHLDYRNSFVLLALAGKHVRLLRCDHGELEAMPMPDGVPESVKEFTGEELSPEPGRNHAAGVRFGTEETRENSPHFRRDFMKAIDRGLQPLLRSLGLPLVLAGVTAETAAYTAVSGYGALVPEAVQLSPDGGATGTELAVAASEIMRRWRSAAEMQAVTEYEHTATGRRSVDSGEILRAASEGRIHHLFLARGGRLTGNARWLAGGAAAEAYVYRNDNLLNAAAVDALLHKGMVWRLEPEQMPEAAVMAAVLRYADEKAGE
ncbi:MAG: hypothetical protein ACKV2U_25575 [Bryobacteraceae bacterium]